jgi:CelD/BcsL family acetyltransferase involved in cellulose biosynthesis
MPERHYKDLGLTIEVVTSLERLEALGPDYDQLYKVANVGLPFELHEWHIAWWKAFASNSLAIRDRLLFHVARNAAEGCVGIVPLVLTERPGYGPLRIGTLALIGTDQYITELKQPTIAPGFRSAVGGAVHRSLASDSRWDWAHWTGIDPDFERTVSGLGTVDPLPPSLDYVLDLTPTWEEFKSGLKRNIRESIRHCYNSLKRENMEPSLVVAKTPAEVRSWLDTFVRLHAARADLDDTVSHPDRFGSPMARGFLYDVCLKLAERDITRVFLLKIKGELVAARVGFEMNDTLYLYYSGFDPAWRKYSVMTTLVTEAVKYAIERKLKTVNLSAGTDVSKTRWGARAVPFTELLQLRSRARSQLASKAYRTARTANTNHPLVRALLRALPRREWGGTQG